MHAECCGEAGFNAATASATMIYPNPSDEVLRSAHLITLYDPRIPGWNLILIDEVDRGTYTGKTWNVVDIPADSTNPDAVQRWRDSIAQVRSTGP